MQMPWGRSARESQGTSGRPECPGHRERGTKFGAEVSKVGGAGPQVGVGEGIQGLVSLDFIPNVMRGGGGL